MVFRFILAVAMALLATHPGYAKDAFNIKGIKLGDALEDVKKVFPEIVIEAFENKARCKGGDVVIENGSSFTAVKSDDFEKYTFKLIFVDGVQRVIKEEFSYVSTAVSRELFMERINEKYDIAEINDENILTVKTAMSDYKGFSHFIVPTGHFFEIQDDDVLRLKYVAAKQLDPVSDNLVHTLVIESKKFNALDENQNALGKQDKIKKEDECGRLELQELGL